MFYKLDYSVNVECKFNVLVAFSKIKKVSSHKLVIGKLKNLKIENQIFALKMESICMAENSKTYQILSMSKTLIRRKKTFFLVKILELSFCLLISLGWPTIVISSCQLLFYVWRAMIQCLVVHKLAFHLHNQPSNSSLPIFSPAVQPVLIYSR